MADPTVPRDASLPMLGAPPLDAPVALEHRLARKVLKETLRVKAGENVVIETWSHAIPWAVAFVYEARRLGAHPLVLYEDEATFWKSVETLPAKQLGKVGDHEWGLLGKTHAYVFLRGPADRPRLGSLPPSTREALHAFNQEWYARAHKAHLRGARLWLSVASEEQARHFNIDPQVWRQELVEATMVDTATLVREAKRVAAALTRGKRLTLDHPNGTHLELRLKGRSPSVEDGVVGPEDLAEGENMTAVPSGLVSVAVDESFAEGNFHANRTSYLEGTRAEGGAWTFREGKLVAHTYRSGGEAFSVPFQKAPKGKEKPGILSIGLNPKISRAPQLEDLERGVVCLAVGGDQWFGGSNPCAFMSWLALGGADLKVDGKLLVQGGNIV